MALIQYFSPLLFVDMKKMAIEFHTTVSALENELMQLILDGQIQARIDSHKNILFAKELWEYEKRARILLLRASFLQSKLLVKNSQGETSGQYGVANSATNQK